ncbi:fused MFS/spermidine synthase [Candidatus Sumerlaeota bacterium]|nr:fused MFS/spermidine synthase [Candidatus Sumerlaeota bacterium]
MKRYFVLLFTLFVLSGFAGLTYEVVWSKYLALFLGASGYAQLLVLSTFMGGLALGSVWLGARSDRMRRPVVFYAWLELGVGIWGFLFPLLFPWARDAFMAAAIRMELSPGLIFSLKLLICMAFVLVPTTLMGGTLPVMTRAAAPCLAAVGRNVSSLYYINSFGAALGCVGAGFFLIPRLGLAGANMTAATLNVAVAGLALWAERGIRRHSGELEDAHGGREVIVDEAHANEALEPERNRQIAVWAAGISGALAMMYEVIWIRLLTLTIGSSTYSFSLMLSAFITGITLGSWILSKKKTPGGYFLILGASQLAAGVVVLLSLPVYPLLPYFFFLWVSMLNHEPYAFPLYQVLKFIFCFLVMVPPAVFFGISLPAASHVAADKMKVLGRQVGGVFAVNTLGTIIGTLTAGLVCMPLLGLQGSIMLCVLVSMLLAIGVLWNCSKSPWAARLRFASLPILLFGLAWFYLLYPSWNHDMLNRGYYYVIRKQGNVQRTSMRDPEHWKITPPLAAEAISSRKAELESEKSSQDGMRRMLYQKDGVNATVAVFQSPYDPKSVFLKVNGKTDASSQGDIATQLLVSHLPLIVKGGAEDVLVIGLGSGMSMGAALQHKVKRVDAVEILPEVVEAAGLCFSEHNNNAVNPDGSCDDSRAHLYLDDAKTFMQTTRRQYDVIVSEPTNPWIAGVAGLFSKEFFETVDSRLKEDGLLAQWLQSYYLEDEAMWMIIDTLQQHFPYVVAWNSQGADIILLSSRKPITPDFAAMEQAMAQPGVRKDLERINVRSLWTLLTMQLGELPLPAEPIPDSRIHSDIRPKLDYIAPRGMFLQIRAPLLETMDQRLAAHPSEQLWLNRYAPPEPISADEFYQVYTQNYHMAMLRPEVRRSWCKLWVEAYPDDERAQVSWIMECKEGLAEQQRMFEERLIPGSGELYTWESYALILGMRYVRSQQIGLYERHPELEAALRRCIELGSRNSWRYYRTLAELLTGDGRFEEGIATALEGLNALPESSAGEPELTLYRRNLLLIQLADCALAAGDLRQAEQAMERIDFDRVPEWDARQLRDRLSRLQREGSSREE